MSAADFAGTSRYRILRRLGAGGMGVVYEAMDTERDARVALKTLRSLDANSLLRFKSEFRALADIGHKNLVTLFDLVADKGTWFFTMELVSGSDFLSWARPGVVSDSISDASGADATEQQIGETLAAASDPKGSVLGAAQKGTLNEPRLRSALVELAHGLSALHAAGKVHRDVKPTNVIVTPQGRVVLVDFGLVTDAVSMGGPRSGESIVGTVAYMAPEQAAAEHVGPEADWYAVGVMLYEALTGELPFQGSAYEVLANKQRVVPPPPRGVDPTVPEDLDALCMDLLKTAPETRPGDAEVLARLGARKAKTSTIPPPMDATFVGRERELGMLERAYEDVRRGTGVTVYVHGESGVGKTALVRRFTSELGSRDPDVMLLPGRCYERESMPFKAIDGVIDALSRQMMRMPKGDAGALMPVQAAMLAHTFPVLKRYVPSHAVAAESFDPAQQRARVLAALRETFQRIASRACVVLLIDDLQWADSDSLLLLREIMRPPDAPPLLLISTVRTAGKEVATSIAVSRLNVGSGSMPGDVRIVAVERLPPKDALALAEVLFRRARKGDEDGEIATSRAVAIAEEAGGHPLFIDELVRHSMGDSVTSPATSKLKLEEALWARIDALEPASRRLVEIACLAGTPIDHAVAARAAGIEDQTVYDRLVAGLRGAHLLRTTQARGAAAIEPYHDRVRQSLLEHTSDRAKGLHGRIADALLASGTTDFELVAQQAKAAGDLAKAGEYAARAADHAMAVLAFDRAVRLFDEAIELSEPTGERATDLFTKLGQALVAAGRGAEAAAAFEHAAEHCSTDDAIDLQLRAATQLLVSGRIDAGLARITSVLPSLDIPLPEATRRASFLYHRARLALRGYSFKPKPSEQIAARSLRQIDACYALSMGLGFVDTVRALEFQARGLLLALAAGEPLRVARGLTFEVGFVATEGHSQRPKWKRILEQAQAVLSTLDDPYAHALLIAAEGVAELLSGNWKRSLELCDHASTALRGERLATAWELDTCNTYSLRALMMMGELKTLGERARESMRDADARGDQFLSTNIRIGGIGLFWLAEDDPTSAQDALDLAMQKWSGHGQSQHLQELIGRAQIDLYAGEGKTANLRVERAWQEIEEARHLRIELWRIAMRTLRANTAIAWARDDSTRRRTLLEQASREANDVARTGAPWGLACATLLRGAIAEVAGDRERALVSYEHAAESLSSVGMKLHANVAKMRAGALMGGDSGAEASRVALEWMHDQGIVRPDRIASLIAPSR